jgi:acetyl esterase/lipase
MEGWQGMDQATLDDAYANRDYIPDADAFPPRWADLAAAFRAEHPPERIAYAERPGAVLDLFLPDDPPTGLLAFIHGGYWRAFGPSDWSHFAVGGLARGHAVAMIGYPLAPIARIAEITHLVSRALDTAAGRMSGPVRVTGHSAGGHLAARLVIADAAPACRDRIATSVPISPVADLRPLVPQTMNDDLRLDAAEAETESPILGQPIYGPRIAVHVGGDERPSFLWQAEQLASAWNAPLRVAEGRHHFDVIDALTDADSDLMRDLFEQQHLPTPPEAR